MNYNANEKVFVQTDFCERSKLCVKKKMRKSDVLKAMTHRTLHLRFMLRSHKIILAMYELAVA